MLFYGAQYGTVTEKDEPRWQGLGVPMVKTNAHNIGMQRYSYADIAKTMDIHIAKAPPIL